ncbi:hypothetical protein K505DRAFT_197347, partial [Melanomma pulvis-pyrius CBS 109.77]
MPLLDLPCELLCLVLENLLLQRDMNALARTNRFLYDLLNIHLYRYNVQHSGGFALLWAAERGQLGTARMSLEK